METTSQNEHVDAAYSFEPIKLGMEFDSDEHAYEYYKEYAAIIGFSVRKEYANKSKVYGYVTSRKFTCCKEGFKGKDKRDVMVKKPRKKTRTGCLAHMVVSRQSNGKFYVTSFEEKHNHPFIPPTLDTSNVMNKIPDHYIMKRKDVPKLIGMEINVLTNESDPKVEVSTRYRHLCQIFHQIAIEASKSRKGYELALKFANELIAKLNEISKRHESQGNSSVPSNVIHDDTIFVDGENVTKVTGLKKKTPTPLQYSTKEFYGKGQEE